MNEYFTGPGANKNYTFTDNGIILGREEISYSSIEKFTIVSAPGLVMPGIAACIVDGKNKTLAYKWSDRERFSQTYVKVKKIIEEIHGIKKEYKYVLQTHTGTALEVYETYLIIEFVNSGSFMANAMKGGGNGGKRLNISDISAIQFKEPAAASVGFMQFSYPGSVDSKAGVLGAINDENSVLISPENLELAREIYNYIEKRREEIKQSPTGQTFQSLSTADEILKFKNLLDSQIITQEEFDAKKRQLLGL